LPVIAVLTCSGLASPVRGEDGVAAPPYTRQVLSETSHDVLRRGAIGPAASVPEWVTPGPEPQQALSVVGGAPDPTPLITHIGPGREGIGVPIPPTSSAPTKLVPPSGIAGYQSNSWRQTHPETARSLSFSSGLLAASAGLDPALKAQADRLRSQGGQFVYGFLLLRTPLEGALEKKLAGLGVRLLGPHDSHHKARLPVGSVDALAALPEVEWVGVSAPHQKVSAELSALRAPQGKGVAVDPGAEFPIVINLFEGDQSGDFRRQLEAAGAAVGEYDPALFFYRAVASSAAIEKIAALDFVLFIEMIQVTTPGHDQSTPLVDADWIRPGGSFPPRFSGASTRVGILDTGAAITGHADLNKFGCGLNFTTDPAGAFDDQNGHGTHVLTTISGTGTANSRFRGVATGVGSTQHIRVGKIWKSNNQGLQSWMESGMDFMANASECGTAAPEVINISGGAAGVGQTGTDSTSRKLDDKVWTNRQTYVVCSGNSGPGSQTIWSPGVAKNALTVGNVLDNGYLSVGDLNNGSSRGPTGDGRMKPNLVGPGTTVTSALAGTKFGYTDLSGCSMATPHVSGLAATLMEHYPEFQDHPALLRAHMMATAIAHDDVTGKSNDFGLGRVSGYLEHWAHLDAAGWTTNWFWGGVNSSGFQFGDVTVPAGAQRLVVVMTWDEPAASSGASRAVTYDLDLWIDKDADCTDPRGTCGEVASVSSIDNVEYIVINNPAPGTYRLKVTPFNAPSFSLRYGLAAVVIRGDPTPPIAAFLSAPPNPVVGSTFAVTATVSAPSYLASGVQIEPTLIPLGVTLLVVQTTRADGVSMNFLNVPDALTLGNVVSGLPRSATWLFRADTTGPKTFKIRTWSENGGEVTAITTPEVVPVRGDLVETALTLNPPAPVRAPGTMFSVSDTVTNAGMARVDASTTRYYLSLDSVKSAGDILLGGTHPVHGMDPGASHTSNGNATIPTATPPGAYYLLACADDLNVVAESNEGNNCLATSSAVVTVSLPDLVETVLSTNPAPVTSAPGTRFSVTDTVKNTGAAPSGTSTTRYYLSLDGVKNAGDTLLTGSRAVPGLAAGASHSGTVTVTIPPTTPVNSYFLLACADDLSRVAETNEASNCLATPTAAVTVTRPDLVENSVSAPPVTKARGTAFTVTDTVLNGGAVASGVSTTRYYLSLDAVKGTGDTLLTGSRTVPGLAAGGTHSGTATVTIPAATPLNTYFLLACADDAKSVVETDEANNCKASSTTVTVTP
jgi:subtilisin family serine protease